MEISKNITQKLQKFENVMNVNIKRKNGTNTK